MTILRRLIPFSVPDAAGPDVKWWHWDRNARGRRKPANHRHSMGGGGGGASRAKAPGYRRAPLQEMAFKKALERQLGVAQTRKAAADLRSGKTLARAMGRPMPKDAKPAGKGREVDRELLAAWQAFEAAQRGDREPDQPVDPWAEVVDPDAVTLDDGEGE